MVIVCFFQLVVVVPVTITRTAMRTQTTRL